MLIIVDKKIPDQAKKNLNTYGDLVELETSDITYEAISGHPDIFFHQAGNILIVAPNLPVKYLQILEKEKINYKIGEQDVGSKYPASSAYNAVSTKNLLIHNFRNTDSVITKIKENADLLHVDQGYTRCNLLALDDNNFLTSDAGIARVLERFDKDSLSIDPKGILLEGFDHGFFGGCCGIKDKKIFILGSLEHYPEGNKIREYIAADDYDIIELYEGLLFDGGSIIFIDSN